MRVPTRRPIQVLAALCCGAALLASGLVRLAAAPPLCNGTDEAVWTASQDTLGLFVVDRHRTIGGAVGAVKFADQGLGHVGNKLLGGYYPVSGYKQMACGTMAFWNLYKLGDHELDLHANLKLAARYRPLIDDPPRGKPVCPGCLWGEVTVPRDPNGFEWFWKKVGRGQPPVDHDNKCNAASEVCGNKTLELSAGKFCIYGPWIMEKAHSYHPEIHPVQAFWGQAVSYASLYFLNDDSRRFELPERFDEEYLSASPFQPWSGSLEATVFQVVRIAPGRPGSLEWRDNKTAPGDVTLDEVKGLLSVKAPSWLRPHVARVCAAPENTTQIVLAAPVELNSTTTWRGVDVFGSDTGIAYGRGNSESSSEDHERREDDAPWDVRSVVEWREFASTVRRAVAVNETEWGITGLRAKWYAVSSQRLLVSAFKRSEDVAEPEVPEGLRSEWAISAIDLDHGGVPLKLTEMTVALDHDRTIPTTIPPGVIENRRKTRGEFALSVGLAGGSQARNVKLTVIMRLSNREHTHSERFVMYSLVPDFLEAVSGYSFKRQKGAFPEALSRIVPGLVRGEGCTISSAQFAADLAGSRPPVHGELDPLILALDDRLRQAGIVRQTVAFQLRDGTIDSAEFAELRSVLTKYAAACRMAPRPSP